MRAYFFGFILKKNGCQLDLFTVIHTKYLALSRNNILAINSARVKNTNCKWKPF